MHCGSCGHGIPYEARFCPGCGSPAPPPEDPSAVARYRDAMRAMTSGGRLEPWMEGELAVLRAELEVEEATHLRLVASLGPREASADLGVWLDAATVQDFRQGQQGLLRLRVRNEGLRALGSLCLRIASSALPEMAQVMAPRVLGPGHDEVLQVLIRPEIGGHHQLHVGVEVRGLTGEARAFHAPPVGFKVGAAAALQQNIHIDARSQRVGIFENIGASDGGGVVATATWSRLELRPGALAEVGPRGGGSCVGKPQGGRLLADGR